MQNKLFYSQSYQDGPNYGRIFRDETQRRVHCPDLATEQPYITANQIMWGVSAVLAACLIGAWLS